MPSIEEAQRDISLQRSYLETAKKEASQRQQELEQQKEQLRKTESQFVNPSKRIPVLTRQQRIYYTQEIPKYRNIIAQSEKQSVAAQLGIKEAEAQLSVYEGEIAQAQKQQELYAKAERIIDTNRDISLYKGTPLYPILRKYEKNVELQREIAVKKLEKDFLDKFPNEKPIIDKDKVEVIGVESKALGQTIDFKDSSTINNYVQRYQNKQQYDTPSTVGIDPLGQLYSYATPISALSKGLVPAQISTDVQGKEILIDGRTPEELGNLYSITGAPVVVRPTQKTQEQKPSGFLYNTLAGIPRVSGTILTSPLYLNLAGYVPREKVGGVLPSRLSNTKLLYMGYNQNLNPEKYQAKIKEAYENTYGLPYGTAKQGAAVAIQSAGLSFGAYKVKQAYDAGTLGLFGKRLATGFILEKPVKMGAEEVRKLFPDNVIGENLFTAGTTAATVVSPTLIGAPLFFGFGREAVLRPVETTQAVLKRPDLLVSSLVGGAAGTGGRLAFNKYVNTPTATLSPVNRRTIRAGELTFIEEYKATKPQVKYDVVVAKTNTGAAAVPVVELVYPERQAVYGNRISNLLFEGRRETVVPSKTYIKTTFRGEPIRITKTGENTVEYAGSIKSQRQDSNSVYGSSIYGTSKSLTLNNNQIIKLLKGNPQVFKDLTFNNKGKAIMLVDNIPVVVKRLPDKKFIIEDINTLSAESKAALFELTQRKSGAIPQVDSYQVGSGMNIDFGKGSIKGNEFVATMKPKVSKLQSSFSFDELKFSDSQRDIYKTTIGTTKVNAPVERLRVIDQPEFNIFGKRFRPYQVKTLRAQSGIRKGTGDVIEGRTTVLKNDLTGEGGNGFDLTSLDKVTKPSKPTKTMQETKTETTLDLTNKEILSTTQNIVSNLIGTTKAPRASIKPSPVNPKPIYSTGSFAGLGLYETTQENVNPVFRTFERTDTGFNFKEGNALKFNNQFKFNFKEESAFKQRNEYSYDFATKTKTIQANDLRLNQKLGQPQQQLQKLKLNVPSFKPFGISPRTPQPPTMNLVYLPPRRKEYRRKQPTRMQPITRVGYKYAPTESQLVFGFTGKRPRPSRYTGFELFR